MKNNPTSKPVLTKIYWHSLLDKTKLSLLGCLRVLIKWPYLLLALLTIIIFGAFFGVLAIGSSEWNLLTSSLPIKDKLDILTQACIRFFSQVPSVYDAMLVAVVVLQGITIALLAYTLNQQRKSKKEQDKSSSARVRETTAASFIATLGLGCSACGTSLIIPLLSLLSTSAIFLGAITTVIVVVALLLLLHSSWQMGYQAFAFTSVNN